MSSFRHTLWTRETTVSVYRGIVRWRWAIIAATVVTVLAAGSGLRFIEFSNNYRVFFSPENPQLQAFEQLQNIYTKSDNVLLVVAPKDGRVFTRDTLATVKWITQEAWKLPYSSRAPISSTPRRAPTTWWCATWWKTRPRSATRTWNVSGRWP